MFSFIRDAFTVVTAPESSIRSIERAVDNVRFAVTHSNDPAWQYAIEKKIHDIKREYADFTRRLGR